MYFVYSLGLLDPGLNYMFSLYLCFSISFCYIILLLKYLQCYQCLIVSYLDFQTGEQ